MTKLLISFFLLLFSSILHAQELKYNILWGEKNVGEITASKVKKGDSTTYKIIADANFKVLFNYHIEYYTKCIYTENKITHSYANYELNDKVKEETTIKHKNGTYTCDNCKDFDTEISPIGFSISKLYFFEPSKSGKVFSERFGEYVKIFKESEHVFRMHLPNGNDNFYHYKDGNLVKVSVDRALYSMDFVLVE